MDNKWLLCVVAEKEYKVRQNSYLNCYGGKGVTSPKSGIGQIPKVKIQTSG